MGDSNAIVPLGDLSKPANTLIEKISDAIGGIFKPHQIRRLARAEADAEITRATTLIKITELELRALERFVTEEAKKQENMESITRKAITEVSNQARPENMENDWITNFFDKCRLISDEEMQALWARILAGEANSPGSYSKRTVNFLASLDKSDAQLFTNLCRFIWMIDEAILLVYDFRAEIYAKNGLSFDSLTHLDTIGLIKFASLEEYSIQHLPKNLVASYCGTSTILELQKETDNEVRIGQVLLTKVGQELAPVCGSDPSSEFRDYILRRWKEMGYIKAENPEPPAPADS